MKYILCIMTLLISFVSMAQKEDVNLLQQKSVMTLKKISASSSNNVVFTKVNQNANDRAVNQINFDVIRTTFTPQTVRIETQATFERHSNSPRLTSEKPLRAQTKSLQMTTSRPKVKAAPTFEKQEK